MATVTQRPATFNREESHRKVTHPLERLRKYIRLYVALEAAAFVVVFLAAWFWIGMILDYGVFKVTALDWVQILPMPMRWLFLLIPMGVLAVMVVTRMAFRLMREFNEAALAMVLERRYFKLLGDRLITAVELADTGLAKKYGYSQEMVDYTIRDAASRVDQLIVKDVFDWKRLYRWGAWVLLLTVGAYLLVGATYCTFASAAIDHESKGPKPSAVRNFVTGFNDVAGMWFERNILLWNTIWPRQAFVEILDFPANGELRVGTTADLPTIKIRYYRWIVADTDKKKAPEGWRPLLWDDLNSKYSKQLGTLPDVNVLGLPKDWRGTVDEVDLRVADLSVRLADSTSTDQTADNVSREQIEKFDKVFQDLTELANTTGMSRKLRRLPDLKTVNVKFKGRTDDTKAEGDDADDYDKPRTLSEVKSSWQEEMRKEGGNRFEGNLRKDIKEDVVQFSVVAVDYVTPTKQIRFIPPPMMKKIEVLEDVPAYIYHRPPTGGSVESLRGLYQKLHGPDNTGRELSTTGDTTRYEVPYGTRLVLKFEADRALSQDADAVTVVKAKGAEKVDVKPVLTGRNKFEMTFDKVTDVLDMNLNMKSRYGVEGMRHVVIRPVDDNAPDMEVQIEAIRKTSQGYLCTPQARIPFSGRIRDDRGLASLEFTYSYSKADSAVVATTKAAVYGSVIPFGFGGLGQTTTLVYHLKEALQKQGDAEQFSGTQAVRSFQNEMRNISSRDISEDKLKERLLKNLDLKEHRDVRDALRNAQIKDLELNRDFNPVQDRGFKDGADFFDVEKLDLKEKGSGMQTKYRLKVWLTAKDYNAETGPGVGTSKERFTIHIVSEEEVLAEIHKERDGLRARLQGAYDRLSEGRVRLEAMLLDLPELRRDLGSMVVRGQQVKEAVDKSREDVEMVVRDFRRIINELEANRFREEIITENRERIKKPLEQTLDPNAEFYRCNEACAQLIRKLETGASPEDNVQAAQETKKQVDELILALMRVLERLEGSISEQKLIADLTRIVGDLEKAGGQMQEIKQRFIDFILGGGNVGGQGDKDKGKGGQ